MSHSVTCIGLKPILECILRSDDLHAKWLNTLSYLENCGARKIAACEHPTHVKEDMLKHAAEEFRHAHYLKRQLVRVTSRKLEDYSFVNMLGGITTLHYLKRLDVQACRYLTKRGFSKKQVKEAAYLLVTYAIECRADKLYPLYDACLRQLGSKVTVRSILLEEQEHLNEMREGLHHLSSGMMHAKQVCAMEEALYIKWLHSLERSINFTEY